MDIATLTPGKQGTPKQWGWDNRALLRQWNSAPYGKQGTGGDLNLRWLDTLKETWKMKRWLNRSTG